MRKREIQSITLKLGELKEYDIAKQERAAAKAQAQLETKTPSTSTTSTSNLQPPIVKVGPKTKQEICDRIGLNE